MEVLRDLAQRIKDAEAQVYQGLKNTLDMSDSGVINTYFAEHVDIAPKKGDVFIVNSVIDGVDYEQSAYQHNGERWIALTGNVDADKVILRDDIIMAGNYTAVGNMTKPQNGTATISACGKSVTDVLTEIFSKRLQPTITAQPSVSGFALSGAKAVEAGTVVSTAHYTAATLNTGAYQYGPSTGVVATKWKVERVTNSGTVQIASVDMTSLPAGTDDNDGNGFIIGDAGGENVVSSLKYKATATHNAGVIANDNLGNASAPAVQIAAGTKAHTTNAYAPFRNYFYGATVDKPTVNSAYIRSLTASGKAYSAGTITVAVPAGATRVAIACIASKAGVTKVINETAMNADVTATFAKSTVSVEGANGYTAKDYNLWIFEPATPYENDATLKVTLG